MLFLDNISQFDSITQLFSMSHSMSPLTHILSNIKRFTLRSNSEVLSRRVGMSLLSAALLTISCASCSDDDGDSYPMQSELVCVDVNDVGVVSAIRTDDGRNLVPAKTITAEVTDTTLRCLCTFAQEQNVARVYEIRHIFSAEPVDAADATFATTDPVKFISAWRSPLYLNLNVGVMTTMANSHQFAFRYDSISTSAAGVRTACFTLLHEQPTDDAESFTNEEFLSVPLHNFADCDSVSINIPTYDGMVTVTR